MKHLSIVTTLYRSESFIEEFFKSSKAAADRLGCAVEWIFVNDGSPDASLAKVLQLRRTDSRICVVDLSRNYGHHKAIMTGLAQARGDWVFLIDSDLEEDPGLLTAFAAEQKRLPSADVIYGVQRSRKGSLGERLFGSVFYRIFNRLSEIKIPENFITARLMSRRYVDSLLAYRDRELYLGGLWALTGFEQVALEVEKKWRGSSTYTFRKRLALLVNSITSFSSRPLEAIFYFGAFILLISTLAGTYLIVKRVLYGDLMVGWPSLIVSIWFLGGLITFCIGVVGIYVSRIYQESKDRPLVTIRDVHPAEDSRV